MKNLIKTLGALTCALAVAFACVACYCARLQKELDYQTLRADANWYDAGCGMRAMRAVNEYCDSTADTGQMDEFLQSEQGREFAREWDKFMDNQL